jgi:hypothetical protein
MLQSFQPPIGGVANKLWSAAAGKPWASQQWTKRFDIDDNSNSNNKHNNNNNNNNNMHATVVRDMACLPQILKKNMLNVTDV